MRLGRFGARSLLLSGLMVAAACMDVAGPHGIRRLALNVYPVFDARETAAGGGDVDSFVIHISNPPLMDTIISRSIEPGQDTIQITVQVTANSGADTVVVELEGFNSATGLLLYQGTDSVSVVGGTPEETSPVAVVYVGPGRRIKTLHIAPNAVAFQIGSTVQFTPAATDSSDAAMPADSAPVVYLSRNDHVIVVNPSGFAQAIANGATWVVVQSVARSVLKDSAQITVAPAPPASIALSRTGVAFADTVGSASPADQTIDVTNSGGSALSGLALGSVSYGAGGSGWLTASITGATAPATITLHVTPGSLAAGHYTATFPVTAPAATNSPQTVSVVLDVVQGATIALAANTASFSMLAGGLPPSDQTIGVSNGGSGPLIGLALGTITYGAGGSGWLSGSFDVTTAPATLTLHVTPGSLGAGHYTATVPVTSPAAANSPQNIAVSFDIVPVLASVTVTPGIQVLQPAGTVALTVTGTSSVGLPMPPGSITYTSRNTAVATVSSGGVVTAVDSGTAVIVASASGSIADSMLVAVARPGQAVASAIADLRAFDRVKAGDTVHVRLTVDLSAVSAEKLGSYNAEVDWDPARLQYIDTATVAGGFTAPTVNATNVSAGQLRFGAADPNGKAGPTVALLDVKFLVLNNPGTSPMTFSLTDLTAAGTFTNLLTQAIVTSASVQIP